MTSLKATFGDLSPSTFISMSSLVIKTPQTDKQWNGGMFQHITSSDKCQCNNSSSLHTPADREADKGPERVRWFLQGEV